MKKKAKQECPSVKCTRKKQQQRSEHWNYTNIISNKCTTVSINIYICVCVLSQSFVPKREDK